jgi:hypothetical protein
MNLVRLILSSPPADADPLRMKLLTKTRPLTKTRFRIRSVSKDEADEPRPAPHAAHGPKRRAPYRCEGAQQRSEGRAPPHHEGGSAKANREPTDLRSASAYFIAIAVFRSAGEMRTPNRSHQMITL